jgi:hypothetical protein
MFGKKERETSKGSRSSQRRLSNNTSSKLQACKPQLGRRQAHPPSATFHTVRQDRSRGRWVMKRSEDWSETAPKGRTHRATASVRSPASSLVVRLLGKAQPRSVRAMAGGLSYLSAKTTLDLKKEIIANKIIGNMRMTKKPEDSRPTTKGKSLLFCPSLVTQVSMPLSTNHADGQVLHHTGMHTLISLVRL